MKTRKKYLLVVVSMALVLTGVIIRQWPDQYVHLVTCDVGQGDAMLIWQGFTQVLIDTGRDEQVVGCLTRYLPFWDKKLELVVTTHADSDHIGGFVSIGERYGMDYLLAEPLGKQTEVFTGFSELISRKQKQGTTIVFPRPGEIINVASVFTLEVFSPQEVEYQESKQNEQSSETELWDVWVKKSQQTESTNDRSIVLLFRFMEVDMLVTGDLEAAGEQALLKTGLLPDIDILKVGHHGSNTSSQEVFLTALRPEIALISSGKNNPYGHPAPEVVRKIEEMGVKILRTDEEGDIHLVSDGVQLWVK